MADIYKGKHEDLEVIRAIKILKPGHTQEDKGRFQTEAKISAHLHHPNIVQIYNVDIWQDALPYIEMEYVEGQSLDELVLKYRRLPPDFALAVCSIICQALEYAQSQRLSVYGTMYTGLVHRDIKPANILLSKTGAVKLADFGIALPGNTSIHTVGPNTMGTYSYLSPEQLDGKQLDQRCDMYALGTVIYETITGFKAFPSHNLPELIRNKLNGTYRPVQALVPDIPKSLIRLIDKSLALDRDKRFATITQFGEAMQKALKDISDKTPQEIITAFIQQPTQLLPVNAQNRFFLFTPEWFMPLSAGLAVLAFIAILMLKPLKNPVASSGESSMPLAFNKSVPEIFEDQTPVEVVRTPSRAVTVTNLGQVNKKIVTPDESSALQAIRRARPVKTNITPVPAASHQQSMLLQSTSPVHSIKENKDPILILEGYIGDNNYAGAIEFAGTHNIDDGYFHLLHGKALYISSNYEQAETILNKAQTTRSKYNTGTKREATYLWALNRVALYKRKPNVENKKIAILGLKNFLLIFCKDGNAGNHCDEAAAIIDKME
jgi:serine/threonine protein kinase